MQQPNGQNPAFNQGNFMIPLGMPGSMQPGQMQGQVMFPPPQAPNQYG